MYRFTITLTDGTVKTVEADSFSGAVTSLLPGDPSDIVSVVRIPGVPTSPMSEEHEAWLKKHTSDLRSPTMMSALTDVYNGKVVPEEEVRTLLRQLPAQGESSPAYQCHKCNAETPPPEPFKLYVRCVGCGALTAATAARIEPAIYGLRSAITGEWDGETTVKTSDAGAYDASALLPLYTSPAPAPLPEGMVLVPREPTDEMIGAACDEEHRPLPMWTRMNAIYKAMLAASPGVQDQGGWISIKDRLPELGQPVVLLDVRRFDNAPFDRLIYDCGYLAEWGNRYWSIRSLPSAKIDAYTHWMPLPPAPAQDSDDKGERV